jgi:hypothetical protein
MDVQQLHEDDQDRNMSEFSQIVCKHTILTSVYLLILLYELRLLLVFLSRQKSF